MLCLKKLPLTRLSSMKYRTTLRDHFMTRSKLCIIYFRLSIILATMIVDFPVSSTSIPGQKFTERFWMYQNLRGQEKHMQFWKCSKYLLFSSAKILTHLFSQPSLNFFKNLNDIHWVDPKSILVFWSASPEVLFLAVPVNSSQLFGVPEYRHLRNK